VPAVLDWRQAQGTERSPQYVERGHPSGARASTEGVYLRERAQARGWRDHLKTLKSREKSGVEPEYRVHVQGINAADYGAPQKRHRAIILGVRADLTSELKFPRATYSQEALVWSQRVDVTYWQRHRVSSHARPAISKADAFLLERMKEFDEAPKEQPWITVRDAIGDLPEPSTSARSRRAGDLPSHHQLHPGARIYERHTGSTWDEPAKALKAGDHGVPGGENVLVGRRGAVRYFTIREMARLQGFPDNFDIDGSWKNPIKQLGNAVPVHVGRAFGRALKRIIQKAGDG
jgi:DNA (cytosine-5)-methyltransferase 1